MEKKRGQIRSIRYKKRWTRDELEKLVNESPFEISKIDMINEKYRKS